MWDWSLGPGEAALVLVALWWGWRVRCAMCQQAPTGQTVGLEANPEPMAAPAPVVPVQAPAALRVPATVHPTPPLVRKAQLFNSRGRLDSVRTIHGEPPETIHAAAGHYRLVPTVTGDHLFYRADPHGES